MLQEQIIPELSAGHGSLTITRRVGEVIVLDESIVFKVSDIQHGQVKIQVVAPRSVAIRRGELRP